jgi:hypothetical protein
MNTPTNPPKEVVMRLKAKAARIGLERSRPVAWETTKALRADLAQRLKAGETADEVENWLDGELAAAVIAQSNRRQFTPSTAPGRE